MMKVAFSSVACPEKLLPEIARLAESLGARGVDLRTFGSGSTEFACDPALSSTAKVSRMFADAGVQIACLSTSCRFDEPIAPIILGRLISDTEKSVREAKYAIDLAQELGAGYIRVFGFEAPAGASIESTTRLVVERLAKVADHARGRNVKVVLENGGSYATASQIAGIIDMVNNPLLGAAYNIAVGSAAGESPLHGLNVLGERAWIVKLKDFRGSLPCALGQGDVPCHEAVRALRDSSQERWLVYEYDRAWLASAEERAESLRGLPGDAAEMIRDSLATIFRWLGEGRSTRRAGVRSSVVA
ncbi:MAG: sugar phosphate isomerase/epimerase [Phycisphaerales bacterium]|nr:sugar phosphate isomerase/epimerase [Phycisphaerales bacterium]